MSNRFDRRLNARRRRASTGPSSFFLAALLTILAVAVCSGALAQNAPKANAPQDPKPETVMIIENKDGSVTIPADQLEKMRSYYGEMEEHNLALKRALIQALKKAEKLENRVCA